MHKIIILSASNTTDWLHYCHHCNNIPFGMLCRRILISLSCQFSKPLRQLSLIGKSLSIGAPAMHNYTFEISRETDRDFIYFPFSFQATIKLLAREVWDEWILTLSDSDKSWLWPTQYSQPSVTPSPPQAGGILLNSYQIPNPHDPQKPKKVTSYDFYIEICDNDKMQFKYRATDEHPFLKGGGTLKIVPIDDHKCSFNWSGKYRHTNDHGYSEKQGDVFAFFICNFFTALAQNIKENVGFEDMDEGEPIEQNS